MRTQAILLIALALALVITSSPAASAVSEGRLTVSGTKIVNQVGRQVLLRGVNYLSDESDSAYPKRHPESAYEKFARLGFNVVRLPISWADLELYPGSFNPQYLTNYVDANIRSAKKYGVYIVLDMHQDKWGETFGGSGIPLWATTNYSPTDQGMREAVTAFWSNTALQDHLITVWKKIASRYVNETTIAGYDILNEPWIYTSIRPDLNASNVNTFYIRIIKAIRSVDENHIIFLEPANMYTRLPFSANIVWSPHFYALSYSHYDPSNSKLLEADLAAKYQKFLNETGSPMWIGEFGAFMNGASAQEWLQDTVRLFYKYEVGWAWWAYSDDAQTIPTPLYATQTILTTQTVPPELSETGIGAVESYAALVIAFAVAIIALIAYETSQRHPRKQESEQRQSKRRPSQPKKG